MSVALLAVHTAPSSCRFVRRKCQHKQLFADSYLRTNRTNHTKIMRCFPHCCPVHRKRSYCGSPLFVQFDQSRGTALAAQELEVFGRFRPLSVVRLDRGDRLSLAAVKASLQRDDPSQGEWIEAELSHSADTSSDQMVSSVYVVNPSGRWYYPWSGAATIALRATDHVFEVLVFRRLRGANDELLQVLATATSSTFRLMSFRRGVATAVPIADTSTMDTSDGGSSDHKAMAARQPKKRVSRVDKSRKIEAKLKVSVKATETESHFRAPSPTYMYPSLRQPTFHSPASLSSVPSRSVYGSRLGALVQWLDGMPVGSASSRRLREWEQLVLDACSSHRAAASGAPHRPPRRELVSILSVLHVSATTHTTVAVPTPPIDVLDSAMRTLLHLFLDVDCCQSSSAAFTDTLERRQLFTAHAAWVSELEHRARRYADSRRNASWATLEATASTLQHHETHIHTEDPFSFRSFVAQTRERYTQQQRRAIQLRRTARQVGCGRTRLSMSVRLDAKTQIFSSDTRVWVSRIEDVAIEMDGVALSLLAVLQFWRQLSCLRLRYSAAQLSLASVFNASVADACFTRLVLDGQYRWFNSLPSGDATTGTTLLGYVVGDYVGRATGAGTLHITTFMWPSDDAQALAHAWHWTLDAASFTTSASVVSVVVESACVQHRDPLRPFETRSIAEKLRSVGRWSHTCQAQLIYHAQ